MKNSCFEMPISDCMFPPSSDCTLPEMDHGDSLIAARYFIIYYKISVPKSTPIVIWYLSGPLFLFSFSTFHTVSHRTSFHKLVYLFPSRSCHLARDKLQQDEMAGSILETAYPRLEIWTDEIAIPFTVSTHVPRVLISVYL